MNNTLTNKEKFLYDCLVLDTETNSDNYEIAEIVESGFARMDNNRWQIFQELHCPVSAIPPKVESICYITNEMVAGKSPFTQNKDEFQSIVNQYKRGFLVAHNYFFDKKVLENNGINLDGTKWICTWRLSKKLFLNEPTIEETNLPYLRFALKLDIPITMLCHRAGHDSFITAKLLELYVDMLEEMGVIDKSLPYGEQIYNWANETIIYENMPIGKYKGQPIASIPTSYWDWAVKNTNWFNDSAENFDPDLYHSIAHALDKK